MTIQEATRYTTDQLKSVYEQDEAVAICELLIGHLAGLEKTNRLGRAKQLLSASQESRLENDIKRLLTHEPIQYVLGETWFCGLKFYVDRRVLIPRPETEELVEWIITGCRFPVDQLKILDIGSGSGCIPIALKRRLGKAEVWSCDISVEALQVSIHNATELGVDVNFVQADFLSVSQRSKLPSCDILVSNPPYIPQKDKQEMQPNVVLYEPAAALFVPDDDPLVFYTALADFGKTHLVEKGTVYAELHESSATGVTSLFESAGYTVEIKKDMHGKNRMLKAGLSC